MLDEQTSDQSEKEQEASRKGDQEVKLESQNSDKEDEDIEVMSGNGNTGTAQGGGSSFSLTPYEALKGKVLTYANKEEMKLFASMQRPFLEGDEKFDCDSNQIFDLIEVARQHASLHGWLSEDPTDYGVCMVPEEVLPNGTLSSTRISIMDNYGKISIETLKKYEETYLANSDRYAQDGKAWYMSLFNSLSQAGRNKVTPRKDDYIVDINGRQFLSGNLLFKIILDVSTLSTRATIRCINQELMNLENTIVEYDYDIIKFNDYVKRQVNELAAHGETPTYLTYYLFRAFLKVECVQFHKYITQKKDEEDDDKTTYSWSELIKLAETKYKSLKRDNLWTVTDPNKEQILALQAEIKAMKKAQKSNNGNKNGKTSQKKRKAKQFDIEKAPKEGEATVITHKDKPMYWCHPDTGGHCCKWRRHKPADCSPDFYANKKKSGNKKSKTSKKGGGDGKKTIIADETILEDDSSGDDEYDHNMDIDDDIWKPVKKQK